MDNDLFNQNLMKKLARDKDLQLNVTKHDLIKEHLSKLENSDFKSETSNYLYFYETILKEILGYNLQENILFDEKEEVGRGKSEFVLKNGDKKFMVVELKGSDSDLDKPQNRANDKRTPVDQAFDYAQHTGDIDWILVSNYNEFRLYNWHTKGKYISFTSDELLEKDVFSYFMLSFSCYSHIKVNLVDKLMENTVVVERELEKEFYKLYNETRLMLIKEFEEINELSRLDAIHYSQMILNRYMFICFAEDMDLLPDQVSTDTILTPIQKGNIRHGSIWQRLNELFLDINEGNEYKKISQYNGGLFKKDLEDIETENEKKLKIRDIVEDQNFFNDAYQNWNFEEYEKDIVDQLGPHGKKVNPIYRNLLIISSFDFSSELDVNILGHIFENSIGDIEELKADAKGRRKKDGIFYTPDYITDYICKNTIIPYLRKNGAENIPDLILEYSDGDEIEDLESKVMNIKIVDPACGSGAFLNKASDILLEIHNAIYDFKKEKYTTTIETKGGKGKAKVKRSATHAILDSYFDEAAAREEILVNNIYGVDLNEESVDITKLALFLKVARKDKQLPDIDNNIKWGNSLIDDPKFTDRPFKWEDEFKEIFDEGGFDVVIGNPPYVRQERIKEIKPYLKDNYEVYDGVADLFVYFFEKGLKILKNDGMFSFICSDRFIMTNYGKNLRKFILKNEFKQYIYHSESAFENATVLACTIIIKKDIPSDNSKIRFNYDFEIPQNKLDDGFWSFENPEILNLREKIEKISIKIKDIPGLKIYRGLTTGFMKAFVVNENTKNKLISDDKKNKDIIEPFVRGIDVQRWRVDYNKLYLILTRMGVPINDYPMIKEYLSQYEEQLTKRQDQGNYYWELRACDYYNEFEKEKIIWADMSVKPRFTFDDKNLFFETSVFFMTKIEEYDLKYLTSLLNSNILYFIFLQISPKLFAKRLRFKKLYVEQLPIYPATPEEQEPFIEKADQMLEMNKTLQNEINSFKEWLTHIFKVEKFSKKLEKYYELSLDEFLAELKKKKVDVKNRENFTSLKEEFEKSVSKIRPLLQEIEETDNEIDQMVYELYGLSDDEIRIIEDSLK
ncbi:MAG: TaqI-like C-terminal specificity domain-containing protein [Methanobacteriaceae archaeon]|nr:TaqI-like C-terminal specificity domain-containing protein [Methanobacteriaceae archaeon]